MRSKAFITSTEIDRYDPTGFRGRPFYEYYRQAQQLLNENGITDLGLILAEAVTSPDGREVDWYAPEDETRFIAVSQLPEEARAQAKNQLDAIWQAINTHYLQYIELNGENNFHAQLLKSLLATENPLARCWQMQNGRLLLCEWSLLAPRSYQQSPSAAPPAPAAEKDVETAAETAAPPPPPPESTAPPPPPKTDAPTPPPFEPTMPPAAAPRSGGYWVFNLLVIFALLSALGSGVYYYLTTRQHPAASSGKSDGTEKLQKLLNDGSALREQYESLQDLYRQKLQGCGSCASPSNPPNQGGSSPASPNAPQDNPPITPPAPNTAPDFIVPKKNRKNLDISFLQGVWHSEELVSFNYDEDYTKENQHKRKVGDIIYVFTFDKKGRGTDDPIYTPIDGSPAPVCQANIEAVFHDKNTIVIRHNDGYNCSILENTDSPDITCHIDGNNAAKCYLYNKRAEKEVKFNLTKGKP